MRTILGKKHFEDHRKHPHKKPDNEFAVTIQAGEVQYSFEQSLYKFSQMQGHKDDSVEAFTLQEEEQEWFDTELQHAMNHAKSKMKPYVKSFERMVTDEVEGKEGYTFAMVHGEGFTGQADEIASSLHEYAVNRLLSRWFTNGGDHTDAAYYEKIADDSLRHAYSEVNSYNLEPIMMENL